MEYFLLYFLDTDRIIDEKEKNGNENHCTKFDNNTEQYINAIPNINAGELAYFIDQQT